MKTPALLPLLFAPQPPPPQILFQTSVNAMRQGVQVPVKQ